MSRFETNIKKRLFLQGFARGLGPKAAARYAGIHISTPYKWQLYDPDFAAAWGQARECRLQSLTDRLGGQSQVQMSLGEDSNDSRLQQLLDIAFDLALQGDAGLLKFCIGYYGQAVRARERSNSLALSQPPVLGKIRITMPGDEKDGDASREFITISEQPSSPAGR